MTAATDEFVKRMAAARAGKGKSKPKAASKPAASAKRAPAKGKAATKRKVAPKAAASTKNPKLIKTLKAALKAAGG